MLAGAPPASAASTVSIPASATTWFGDSGVSGNTSSYLVGHSDGVQHRNVVTFDLTDVHGAITAATVQYDNSKACTGSASAGPADTLRLWDVTATPAQLAQTYNSGDAAGQAIYADLGSGVQLGSAALVTADDSPVSVAFGVVGVAALNAARGGPISFGGTYSEGSGIEQAIFAGTNTPDCHVTLALTSTADQQTVSFSPPSPVTYGSAPIDLSATATSGLTVDFSLPSAGPCALGGPSGSTLYLLGAGVCVVRATQPGDDNWWPAHVDKTIVIDKAPTTTSVTVSPPAPSLNQPVTLTATVAPAANPFAGPTGPTGTVSFEVDGATIATVPLSGHTAAILATLGGGSHTVVARYSGDANFVASDNSGSPTPVEVHCDRTLTGTVGSLTVTSGLTCLSRATVTGGISVAKGGALDLEKSTVNGSISANAPSAVRICGSTTGAITVSAATGVVIIGDPNSMNRCAANRVSSGILVANNRGPVVVIGNTVGTSVTATHNTGGQVITGNHR